MTEIVTCEMVDSEGKVWDLIKKIVIFDEDKIDGTWTYATCSRCRDGGVILNTRVKGKKSRTLVDWVDYLHRVMCWEEKGDEPPENVLVQYEPRRRLHLQGEEVAVWFRRPHQEMVE